MSKKADKLKQKKKDELEGARLGTSAPTPTEPAAQGKWPSRSAILLGLASIAFGTGLQIAGFTAPTSGRVMMLMSFLAWLVGGWFWLQEQKLEKQLFPDRPRLLSLAWLGASLVFFIAVLGAFPSLLQLRAQPVQWRIVIPDLVNTATDNQEILRAASLPALLRQKFSRLAPRVVVVCSDCPDLQAEIQGRIRPDYLLKILLPATAGQLSAEIYEPRRGLLRTIHASYKVDPTEALDSLAEGLLAEFAADGFVPDPQQIQDFAQTPSRSLEALELNNHAAIALRMADAELAGNGSDERVRSNLDQARKSLDRALELDSTFAAALANRAWLDELEGNPGAASAGYKSASLLEDQYAPFFYQLGRFLLYSGGGLESGATDFAVQALERATMLDPTYWQAFNELGNARLRTGEDAKAKEALGQALAFVPSENRWVVEKNLGRAELRLRNLSAAQSHLEVARQASGIGRLQIAEVDYHLAILFSLSANRPSACRALAEARSNDPAEALPLLEPELRELERLKDCENR